MGAVMTRVKLGRVTDTLSECVVTLSEAIHLLVCPAAAEPCWAEGACGECAACLIHRDAEVLVVQASKIVAWVRQGRP